MSIKTIELTKGKQAIVDSSDFDWLNQWKWCYVSSGYAMRREYLGGGRDNENARYILMHRLILGVEGKKQIDHINHNKLDNRRSNLRVSDQSQNMANASIRSDNTTGHKGVYWYKTYGKWTASITFRGKTVSLGYFGTKNDAIIARKQAEVTYHGEFANVHI